MATPKKENKANELRARVTVELGGAIKKKFFDEVNRTGIKEAKLLREIITKYYS